MKVLSFGSAEGPVSDGLTMRSLRATDLSPDRAEGSFDQCRFIAGAVSPSPATSQSPHPMTVSLETSTKLGVRLWTDRSSSSR
jgi:hypothetical protein